MSIAKPFYYNWISLQDIMQKLHALELEESERHELTERILTTVHYEVLDEILSLIPEDEHEIFLNNMQQYSNVDKIFEPHEVTIEVVKTVVKKRGEKVIRTINMVLTEEE